MKLFNSSNYFVTTIKKFHSYKLRRICTLYKKVKQRVSVLLVLLCGVDWTMPEESVRSEFSFFSFVRLDPF